jgi:hypothetical protein
MYGICKMESKNECIMESKNCTFIKRIIHDIRNFKKIHVNDIITVNNLEYYDRLNVLNTYNNVLQNIVKLLDDL